jgi:tryptophan-rich sensory protein
MKRNWKTYLFWIALAGGVGLLAGFLTRDGVAWYTEFAVKPPLSPPAILFPIVWTILYGLMGISAARVRLTPESDDRNRALNLFLIQLGVNFLWSILFFNRRDYGAALALLLVLWILITAMILAFDRVDHPAAWLQVPYLVWVTFALWLNFWVWRLNP